MIPAIDLRQVRIALQRYEFSAGKLPCPGPFGDFHSLFQELSRNGFHIPQKPWLNTFELAAVANYTAMFGSERKHKLRFQLDIPLNHFKKLWKLAEESNSYSDNPAYIATFILRVVYQQLPFVIHPSRVRAILAMMNSLFSTHPMDSYIQKKLEVSGREFFDAVAALFAMFSTRSMCDESSLPEVQSSNAISKALTALAATQTQRRVFHKSKLALREPSEKPYEINSLLRYPISRHGVELYCPYPQLLGYAVTRGLFFRFGEEDKDEFRKPFTDSVERYVKNILTDALGDGAEVLTAADERGLGWQGKTNDVTAIAGNSALMIECKLSGLYVEAKRTASPSTIIADVRKQIADGTNRRGLFQLYDKCEAIRSRQLPPRVMEKYRNVKQMYLVLLLFDEIKMANRAEVMGNIVGDELKAYGAADFNNQVWHLEEFDRFIKSANRNPSLGSPRSSHPEKNLWI